MPHFQLNLSKKNIHVLCFTVCLIIGALLLFRPHQESFFGLDSSSIRWMTRAMVEGRSQTGIDTTLAQVPEHIRTHFLYIPGYDRLTRDRSFQLDSLETCTYRPFFYPFLSYAAIAFDFILPWPAADYFLPTLALFFLILSGWFMFQRAGLAGFFTAAGFILGLPLFVWFARGYYPDLAAIMLIAVAALHWLDTDTPPRYLLPASFMLGLAVCFHPLAALWSMALFMLMISDSRLPTSRVLAAFLCFALGWAPLVVMTKYVAQPYGDIFNPYWLYGVFRHSTLYFLILVGMLCGLLGSAVLLSRRGRAMAHTLLYGYGTAGHVLRLFLALAPTALLLLNHTTKPATLEGLTDLWSLLTSPWGAVALTTIVVSILPQVRPRSKALLVMTVLLAFFYLYLKGIEPFGLWSQRRLLPILIPFLAAALSIWRDILSALQKEHFPKAHLAKIIPAAMILTMLIMFVNHQPFYTLRSEFGSDDVLKEITAVVGDTLTIFDYHQYGSPLTSLAKNNFLAVSNRISLDDRATVIRWAAETAKERPVIWITAYANPGLEENVAFEQIQRMDRNLPRLHSKRIFPEQVLEHAVSMSFLQVRPLSRLQSIPPLDKVMDHGALALRGSWGRADIKLTAPDGSRLPARWTRQGSAVIGPVPPPGEKVTIVLTAAATRMDDKNHQIMTITPPWDGPALNLRIANAHDVVQGVLHRPQDADFPGGSTGEYTLTAMHPYNPEIAGIHGFARDLGVLLHRVRMEVINTGQ
jgi:hypothetical protein